MIKNKNNFKSLKKRTWVLACHINEIKNKNDYKTLDFFDESTIIYNINNNFVAFKNVCAHRGSKIKIKRYGNEVFNCVYHGWTFSKDGILISGPKIKEAFTENQLSNKKLIKMKIAMCGKFIFITEISNKESLENYLLSHFNQIKKYQ